MEIQCIQHNFGECEVDPAICANLNDINTADENIVIRSYENIKNVISFDILSPTNLTQIPLFILRKFPKLQQIRMINTGIKTLNANNFELGRNLMLLDLRRNQIDAIPAKIFSKLKRLESINLAYNQIERIEIGSFDDVPSLKTIILSNNQLKSIEAGSITGAGNLTELYLESNEIHSIGDDALNLPNLEIISLQDNQLTSLPHTVFHNLFQLKKIDLRKNNLTEIGDLFNEKPNLYALNLNDNPELRDIDLFKLTQQIPNLSYLHLANTGFKFTNKPIDLKEASDDKDEPNYSLTHLDLSMNNLSSPDIFLYLTHFKSLRTVILNNNAFEHLNHVAFLKGLFPRLDRIKFKFNQNVDLNWLRRAQKTLKKQNIKLDTEHQFTD